MSKDNNLLYDIETTTCDKGNTVWQYVEDKKWLRVEISDDGDFKCLSQVKSGDNPTSYECDVDFRVCKIGDESQQWHIVSAGPYVQITNNGKDKCLDVCRMCERHDIDLVDCRDLSAYDFDDQLFAEIEWT